MYHYMRLQEQAQNNVILVRLELPRCGDDKQRKSRQSKQRKNKKPPFVLSTFCSRSGQSSHDSRKKRRKKGSHNHSEPTHQGLATRILDDYHEQHSSPSHHTILPNKTLYATAPPPSPNASGFRETPAAEQTTRGESLKVKLAGKKGSASKTPRQVRYRGSDPVRKHNYQVVEYT